MAVRTKVLLDGIDVALTDVDALEHRAGDLSPVWPLLGRLWARRQETVFATGGLGAWPPIGAKALLGGSRSPLVRTGALRRAVSDPTPVESGPLHVMFGVDPGDAHAMKVGNIHRHGSGRVPVRDPMPRLRPTERDSWMGVVRRYLTNGATH
jgi:hypothetical protein